MQQTPISFTITLVLHEFYHLKGQREVYIEEC
jgi:hypothetical protein